MSVNYVLNDFLSFFLPSDGRVADECKEHIGRSRQFKQNNFRGDKICLDENTYFLGMFNENEAPQYLWYTSIGIYYNILTLFLFRFNIYSQYTRAIRKPFKNN